MPTHPRLPKDLYYYVTRLCIIIILLSTTACGSKGKQEFAKPPVPVLVSTSVKRDVPVEINAIGTAKAYSTVSIKSLVGGQLMKVYFKEGQFVKKGDLLFTIDSRPFEAALAQSEANLARDTVLAKNAQEDAQRYASLVEQNLVSRELYDEIHAKAAAQQLTVEADKALVENDRLQLEYCSIRSPIDGRTGSILVHEGNVVKANENPMVVIEQINPINVAFSVPEQYLPEVKRYLEGGTLKVEAIIPQEEGSPEQGTFTFVDNSVNSATGTILLKATFENIEKRLWPGQFVTVSLRLTTQSNVVVVPSQAVQSGQAGHFIYVIKPDMTVESRTVKPGITYKGETVIENGLALGEKVVTDGQLRLVPGAKVLIKTPPEEAG